MEINSVVYFDMCVVLIECSKSCELLICVIYLVQVWEKLGLHMDEGSGADGVHVKIHDSQINHEINTPWNIWKETLKEAVAKIFQRILFGRCHSYFK